MSNYFAGRLAALSAFTLLVGRQEEPKEHPTC